MRFSLAAMVVAAAGLCLPAVASEVQDADYVALMKDTRVSLAEGVEKALAEAKDGVAFRVELEGDKTVHWAVDVSQGAKTLAVDIDAKTGAVVGTENESNDQSRIAKAAKIGIVQAIGVALKKAPGRAVSASLVQAGESLQFIVKVLVDEKLKTVKVDAVSGELAAKKQSGKKEDAKAFTDAFPVDAADWASSGRNPYFVLEPGYFLILEGEEKGVKIRTEINVLSETKTIDGVECRVVQDKVTENGQVHEVARDYFAFAKKTSSVYYFGEDVDNYKDGKVANHEGSWLSGVNGAKYGLQMPGLPLLGARFYQELAPGVGMDRIEIVSLSETFETPAGKFEHCLKTEETSPLEPGVREHKLYAPGIGAIQEGEAKLVKYGMSASK